MIKDKTIIISCAGMGKRYGENMPKALIRIEGKSLIIRHLELLNDCDDVRIVVGYKSEEVIKEVLTYRKDVVFVFNHNYMNNGTGASVSLASKYSNKKIITIDGDLLIHPDDMKKILESQENFIGVCSPSTDNPMLAIVENDSVIGFSRKEGQYEWTGISQFDSDRLIPNDGHVCDMLVPLLPMKKMFLRTKEIDTHNDYDVAKKWFLNNYSDNITIGILGGMGSVATADFFSRIVCAFPAEKEWDRPRILVDNRCSMPSRVRAILYKERYEELVNSLIDSISSMINNNCDYIILACNTSHIFLKDIYSIHPEYEDKILNIIKACADKLEEMNIKKVKLLASEGTFLSGVYNDYLDKKNIKIEKTDETDFSKIREWIEAVKQGNMSKPIIDEFVNYINNSKSKCIILGCTELPIIYSKCSNKINKMIVDPLQCVIDILKDIQTKRNRLGE